MYWYQFFALAQHSPPLIFLISLLELLERASFCPFNESDAYEEMEFGGIGIRKVPRNLPSGRI